MQKKYVFLCGVAAGILIPLILWIWTTQGVNPPSKGVNQSLVKDRYQLLFGKVMQLGADPNYQFEHPVCFRLDMQTGDTKIYKQYFYKEGLLADTWEEVYLSVERTTDENTSQGDIFDKITDENIPAPIKK